MLNLLAYSCDLSHQYSYTRELAKYPGGKYPGSPDLSKDPQLLRELKSLLVVYLLCYKY